MKLSAQAREDLVCFLLGAGICFLFMTTYVGLKLFLFFHATPIREYPQL